MHKRGYAQVVHYISSKSLNMISVAVKVHEEGQSLGSKPNWRLGIHRKANLGMGSIGFLPLSRPLGMLLKSNRPILSAVSQQISSTVPSRGGINILNRRQYLPA
jgi:hypothetical protein